MLQRHMILVFLLKGAPPPQLILIIRLNVGHINFQLNLYFKIKLAWATLFIWNTNVGDYDILCYLCPITNSQHVGWKSS